MKFTKLATRTLREGTPGSEAETETVSHRLMLRAGFIHQVAAGVYAALPLAWRSLRKIENIIREEIDAGRRAGAFHACPASPGALGPDRAGSRIRR